MLKLFSFIIHFKWHQVIKPGIKKIPENGMNRKKRTQLSMAIFQLLMYNCTFQIKIYTYLHTRIGHKMFLKILFLKNENN